jgi:hypothetical protein
MSAIVDHRLACELVSFLVAHSPQGRIVTDMGLVRLVSMGVGIRFFSAELEGEDGAVSRFVVTVSVGEVGT